MKEKIKVLHILNRFNLGGPTYYAAYLTKFMPQEYETLLIGGVKDEEEGTSEYVLDRYDIKPIIIKSMYRSIGMADYEAYKEVKAIIKEYKPDVVHTHAAKAGVLGRLAAKRCGVKVIVHTFHGHVFDKYFSGLKSFSYKNIERFFALCSSKIIALSEQQRYDLVDKYHICSNKKVKVLPLGFDLTDYFEQQAEKREQFRKDYAIEDDVLAIGIIGRLAPIKNHDLFLEAMEIVLQKTTKKVKIFIVGDGEEHQHIENKCRDLGLLYANYNAQQGGCCPDSQVILTSWLKKIDVVNAGLDIVALTSKNEGTPGSLIEAQAANKPIVATNVGGIADIVLEGETALLAQSENVSDYAKKMLEMIENDELRHRLSLNGATFAKQHFHYEQLINSMDVLYKSLLEKKTVKETQKKANLLFERRFRQLTLRLRSVFH